MTAIELMMKLAEAGIPADAPVVIRGEVVEDIDVVRGEIMGEGAKFIPLSSGATEAVVFLAPTVMANGKVALRSR
jgi:hypothetical protein